MAIAFDTATSYTHNSGRTVTQNHTASGSDRVALVHVTVNQGASISAITYGGNAMTLAGSARDNTGTGLLTACYYYINPPTSSTTISATSTGGSSGIVISTVSYTGVDQTTPIDAVNALAVNANRTTVTGTVTVVTANAWLVHTMRLGSGGTLTSTGGSAVRTQPEVVFAGAGAFVDSNAAVSTGSQSVSATCSSQFVGGSVTVALKPEGAAPAVAKGGILLAW
jgi:hypothetical protein